MKIEKLNHWVSIFTNTAVLMGVVALAYELKQNTLSLQDETDVAIYSIATNISLLVANSQELSELLVRAENTEWHELSRIDQNRLASLWGAWLDNAELQFRLYSRKDDTVSNILFPEDYVSWGSFRSNWASVKALYESNFVEYFDLIIAKNMSSSPISDSSL